MTVSAPQTIEDSNSSHRPEENSSDSLNTVRLRGCSPTPLAHYLKGLAVLRILAEQIDGEVRGWWDGEDFHLETHLDEDELIDFFARDYEPTPVASPWNGGSGFKRNKTDDDVEALRNSHAPRLNTYREVIEAAFELLEELGIEGKVKKDQKETFLEACRNRFPERALLWLDAAFVMTGGGPRYPAVLGTGGNDGRLEFGLNFMQRLAKVFDFETGEPTDETPGWLRASLFSEARHDLQTDAAIGQFFPHAAGGTNQTTGFDSDSVTNPWDYILMLEGAVFFAAAAVKRLEATGPGGMSVPFSVRHIGVGDGSTDRAEEDDARDELWIPLWSNPTTARELRALMGEGRARIGRQTAGDGVDFARAISTLGVDRGLTEFHRYGFQQRNGRSYYATPLNRIEVRRRPNVDLLDDIDRWFDTFSRYTRDDGIPGSIQSVGRNLEEAIFRLCQNDSTRRVQDVLICLGDCERQLAKSHDWTVDTRISPLSGLSPRWLVESYDGTPEFRLAASLASVYGYYDDEYGYSIRHQFEPVKHDGAGRYSWKQQVDRDVTWHQGDPVDALGRMMQRRILLATQTGRDRWPDTGAIFASPADIAAFIEGEIETRRLVDLCWGMLAIDTTRISEPPFAPPTDDGHPGSLYALTKLCFPGLADFDASRTQRGSSSDRLELLAEVPVVPQIHRHLLDGDARRASRTASRRLRGSRLSPLVDEFDLGSEQTRRCAAALLFPVNRKTLFNLQKLVLAQPE